MAQGRSFMASDKKELERLDAQEARRQRKEKERRARKRAVLILAIIIVVLALLIVVVLGLLFRAHMKADVYSAAADSTQEITVEYVGEKTETAERETIVEPEAEPEKPVPTLSTGEMVSTNAYMIRPEDGKEILNVNGEERMYPASMTKMMTVIVAIENLDMSQQHTVMYDEISNAWAQDATMAGFAEGETITILDMVYGAMLPSGAECCYGLASEVVEKNTGAVQWDYEAQFVELMNAKASEIGMTGTHFANCVGLTSEDHYSTCKDMAILLEYGLQNDLFREVISSHNYTTEPTDFHPDGLLLNSTMFGSLGSSILTNETSIMGGKTGYTDEAGHCLASYAVTEDETEYILVTSGAYTEVNDYANMRDHKYIYGQLPMG